MDQGRFRLISGGHIRRLCHIYFRFGQGPFIQLAVLVLGNSVHLYDSRRYHVGRFPFPDKGRQCFPVNGFICYYVRCDEFSSCRIVAGHDRRVLHRWEIADDPFHFRQFHPEPADFHQAVPPADKLNVSVQTVAGHIPSPVSGFIIRFLREWVGYKGLFCLLGPVQVASRYLDSRYPELAQGTGGHPAAGTVHDINSRIIHGFADRDIRLVFCHTVTGNGNRGFRRAVFIGHNVGMHRFEGNQRLASYHDVFQLRAVHGQGKLAPHLGRQVCHHNMVFVDNLRQSRQIQLFLFGNNDDTGPHRKCRIHIRQRTVEAVTVVTGDPELFRRRKITPVPGRIGHQVFL